MINNFLSVLVEKQLAQFMEKCTTYVPQAQVYSLEDLNCQVHLLNLYHKELKVPSPNPHCRIYDCISKFSINFQGPMFCFSCEIQGVMTPCHAPFTTMMKTFLLLWAFFFLSFFSFAEVVVACITIFSCFYLYPNTVYYTLKWQYSY